MNWLAFGVYAIISSDQFVKRSHGKNSNIGKTRKKGSAHLLAIHSSSLFGYVLELQSKHFQLCTMFLTELTELNSNLPSTVTGVYRCCIDSVQ